MPGESQSNQVTVGRNKDNLRLLGIACYRQSPNTTDYRPKTSIDFACKRILDTFFDKISLQ